MLIRISFLNAADLELDKIDNTEQTIVTIHNKVSSSSQLDQDLPFAVEIASATTAVSNISVDTHILIDPTTVEIYEPRRESIFLRKGSLSDCFSDCLSSQCCEYILLGLQAAGRCMALSTCFGFPRVFIER